MTDIWQIIVQSNTFNFIIVLVVLLGIVSKLDVKSKIEQLRKEIKAYVDKSSEEKEIAESSLNEINEKLKHLPEELADIKNSAENNIKGIAKRIEFEIEDKKKDIENNANRILNLEIKTFKENLTGRLSQASVDLSRKNAIEQLKNNRELHNKYIYDAINELDGINL